MHSETLFCGLGKCVLVPFFLLSQTLSQAQLTAGTGTSIHSVIGHSLPLIRRSPAALVAFHLVLGTRSVTIPTLDY
jgi:hypothetical protein